MYFREFGLNWRSLVAAGVGTAFGGALSYYTMSLFGPPLLAEFGWSRSQFALIGVLPLATVLLIPFVGRFADRFGVRVAAIVGFTTLSLSYFAFALMSGDIIVFFSIFALQSIFAVLTTALVFCRVVAEKFDGARGIALSLMMMAPPLIGAIAAPVLGWIIAADGWRSGFFALGLVTMAGGVMSIIMLERVKSPPCRDFEPRLTRQELTGLLRDRTLILMLGGMLLINIPQAFASSQLKLLVMDNGVTSETATWMVSLYAVGVLVGRFLCGLALDRMKPHLVAVSVLGLPAVGYAVFAAQIGDVAILSVAVAIIGVAQGAENDVGAYLVSRRFELKNFSLLLSLLTMMIGIGAAVGAVILSFALKISQNNMVFLIVAVIATMLGAVMFGLTGLFKTAKNARSAGYSQTIS